MQRCEDKPFPTAVRWIARKHPPQYPAGYEECDSATLEKWQLSKYAMPPYQFKKEHGVVTPEGEERPPNADERERLHGFKVGHTSGFSEPQRISFIGNSFHCIVVALLLASWAVHVGYRTTVPSIYQLWLNAGYGSYSDYVHVIGPEILGVEQHGSRSAASEVLYDPGVHDYDLGEERVTVVSRPEPEGGQLEDQILHLVQDEETIAELHQCVLPPDDYYEKLGEIWKG